MITKVDFSGDGVTGMQALERLKDFLIQYAVPGYFDSVTINTIVDNSLECYVGDTLFLKLTNHFGGSGGGTVTVTTASGSSLSKNTYGAHVSVKSGYVCQNGIVIETTSSVIGICKSSGGATTVVAALSGSNGGSFQMETLSILSSPSLIAISVDDSNVNLKKAAYTQTDITCLCPIPVNCVEGHYTKELYYTPFYQLDTVGPILIDGASYLSGLGFVISDADTSGQEG